MLLSIESPFIPYSPFATQNSRETQATQKVVPIQSIPSAALLGILVNVYTAHWQYENEQVGNWLERLQPFITNHCMGLFFTKDGEPYGVATWVLVSQQQHFALLNNATHATLNSLQLNMHKQEFSNQPDNQGNQSYLWFTDYITPFSHALDMTKAMQKRFSKHKQAWALNVNPNQTIARQVW